MGFRNVLILFFSAMAVSLVILILFFSLFFKNFDDMITFDTKLPESAPDVKGFFSSDQKEPSKAQGINHATINVPPERSGSLAPHPEPSESVLPKIGAGVEEEDETSEDSDELNETPKLVEEAKPAHPISPPPSLTPLHEKKKTALPPVPPLSKPEPPASPKPEGDASVVE